MSHHEQQHCIQALYLLPCTPCECDGHRVAIMKIILSNWQQHIATVDATQRVFFRGNQSGTLACCTEPKVKD